MIHQLRQSWLAQTVLIFAVMTFGILIGMLTTQAQTSGIDDEPDAIYNYRRWNYQVKGEKYIFTEAVRLTINNRRGDQYADLTIVTNGFTKLKRVEASVTDAYGTEIFDCNKKDLKKICGYGSFNGYTDNCFYTVTLQANRYPYTVEYEYTLESKSLFFLQGEVFQSMVPVAEATYTLNLPTSLEFSYQTYGFELDPIVTEKKKRSTYIWQATDIPAREYIELAPPGENDFNRLAICIGQFTLDDYPFSQLDWQNVGQWYNNLAEDRYQLAGADKSPLATDQQSTAKTVYDRVIDEIRYVDVQIGVGGWQPYSAKTTAKRAWGDCKDMSTLLIARLREKNIRALPALVLTRSAGPVDTDFPSFKFNHVIAVALIGNDTIWMDPTCNMCPYGDLPNSVEDIDLLLISETGGKIVRTPLSKPEDNRFVRKTTWQLDEGGLASFTSKIKVYGNRATNYRYRLSGANSDQQRKFVERLFRGVPKRLSTTSYQIDLPDSLELPVTITLSGKTKRPADRMGTNLYLAMMRLIRNSSIETVELEDRLLPIDIGYPWQNIDTVELLLTPELVAAGVYLPMTDSISASFGHYYRTTTLTDSLATIIVEKEYSVSQIAVDQLPEFVVFTDSLKGLNRKMTRIANQ